MEVAANFLVHSVVVDTLGDALTNHANHNRRHNAILRGWYDAKAAVSVDSVLLGDKSKGVAHYSEYNADHVPDTIELRATKTGGDRLGEVKCYNSLKKGTAAVGHVFAFGNTEEHARRLILGCKAMGRARDGRFNPTTGIGRVEAHKGHYADALRKGTTVNALISNPLGGLAPATLAHLFQLDRTAKGTHGRDRTVYTSWTAPSFLPYYKQKLSSAAVICDAAAIEKLGNVARHRRLHGIGVVAA